MEPFDTYAREWPVIAHAPLSAVTIIMASLAAGAGLAAIHFRGRIETVRDRLKLRDEQLASLREKLQNAPNAEAALRAATAELEKQRRLAEKEKRNALEPRIRLSRDDGIVSEQADISRPRAGFRGVHIYRNPDELDR